MAKDYSVSDIKVMEGLEAVRMRPRYVYRQHGNARPASYALGNR